MSEGHHVLVVQAVKLERGRNPQSLQCPGFSLEVTVGGCGSARSRFASNFSACSHRQTGLLLVEPGKRSQSTFRARSG